MKTRGSKMQGEEIALNMTPMIDVVFQLLIFFMLVTEIAQAELEQLELPSASKAQPDDAPEKKRIIINVCKPGPRGESEIKIRGKVYNLKMLYTYLKTEADISRDPTDPRLSIRPVLVRSDRDTPFRFVQAVMQECVKPGVGIWKLQFAVKEPDKGGTASGGGEE